MAQRKAYDLRPLDFGDILSRSFSLYTSNFMLFAGLYMLLHFVPVALMTVGAWAVLSRHFSDAGATMQLATGIGSLLGTPFSLVLAGGAIYYLIARTYLGAETGIWEGIQQVFRRLGSLIVAGIIYTLMFSVLVSVALLPIIMAYAGASGSSPNSNALASALLLTLLMCLVLVPLAVYLSLRFALVFCVIMLEDAGPFEAFRRSSILTENFRLRLLGVNFVMGICISLLSIPGGMAQGLLSLGDGGLVLVGAIVAAAWTSAITPLQTIPLVIYYFDLRCRKEGFDLAVLAQTFGVDPGTLPQYQPGYAGGYNPYAQAGYAPHGYQHGYAPQSYPPQTGYTTAGYAPPQPGYPPQAGYAPQQPGYPPQAGYQPQEGASPQQVVYPQPSIRPVNRSDLAPWEQTGGAPAPNFPPPPAPGAPRPVRMPEPRRKPPS